MAKKEGRFVHAVHLFVWRFIGGVEGRVEFVFGRSRGRREDRKGETRIGGATVNQHFAQIFTLESVAVMHEGRRDVGIRVLYRMG